MDRNFDERGEYIIPEVALLAEGVDRNWLVLSIRPRAFVALLAEGVDRNYLSANDGTAGFSRPPRGGRG